MGAHRTAGAVLAARGDARPGAPAHVSDDDWSDALTALAAAGARFLVVGAHAMAVHGVPRGTQDLDVWIDPSEENAERVCGGLATFGPPLEALGISREDLGRSGTVIQLGLPPNRIDLLTAISGVPDFEAAWAAIPRPGHPDQEQARIRAAKGPRRSGSARGAAPVFLTRGSSRQASVLRT